MVVNWQWLIFVRAGSVPDCSESIGKRPSLAFCKVRLQLPVQTTYRILWVWQIATSVPLLDETRAVVAAKLKSHRLQYIPTSFKRIFTGNRQHGDVTSTQHCFTQVCAFIIFFPFKYQKKQFQLSLVQFYQFFLKPLYQKFPFIKYGIFQIELF